LTSDHDFATEEVRKPRRLQGRHHAKPSFSMVSDCGKGLRQFCADRRKIYSYPQNGTIMLKCPLLLDFEVSALHHAFHAEAVAVPLATMHAASTRHIGYWLSWPPGYAELGLPPDLAHLRASPAAAQPPQSMRCVRLGLPQAHLRRWGLLVPLNRPGHPPPTAWLGAASRAPLFMFYVGA